MDDVWSEIRHHFTSMHKKTEPELRSKKANQKNNKLDGLSLIILFNDLDIAFIHMFLIQLIQSPDDIIIGACVEAFC